MVKGHLLSAPALCFTDRAIKDTLFKLDAENETLIRLTNVSFDFFEHRSVQVGCDILAFSQEPLRAIQYVGISNMAAEDEPVKIELSDAGQSRQRFSVANYANETVYVTGGETLSNDFSNN